MRLSCKEDARSRVSGRASHGVTTRPGIGVLADLTYMLIGVGLRSPGVFAPGVGAGAPGVGVGPPGVVLGPPAVALAR